MPIGTTLLSAGAPFAPSSAARSTRRILSELADHHTVAFLDIDAEERLDLARRLTVLRPPTVLLLDGAGRITHRVSGPPRRAELAAAVGELVGAEAV